MLVRKLLHKLDLVIDRSHPLSIPNRTVSLYENIVQWRLSVSELTDLGKPSNKKRPVLVSSLVKILPSQTVRIDEF